MADNPDPKDLTDEELDKILAGEESEEEEQPEEQPKPGEQSEEESQEESEEEQQEEEEPEEKPKEETEEKPPSRREQRRIQDLLRKYGDPEDREERKPEPPKPKASDKRLDYEQQLEADPDTIKKLEDDRRAYGEDAFQQGLSQANSLRFMTRLEIDAPRVEAKYPQLDKNSKEFKPDVANDVNTLFLNLAGYDDKTGKVTNPEFRYSEFIDAFFSLANDVATEKAQETTKNIKKQAAQTGLRPDGSRGKKLNLNKPPEQMTDEELDAYIAQAIPPKR